MSGANASRRFFVATEEEIKRGRTTDIYFERAEQILREKGLDDIRVAAEVTTGDLPDDWQWALTCGQVEVVKLFEGVPVDIDGMTEGTVFRSRDVFGTRVPVMNLSGRYVDFARFETPGLGLICQASGIATRAARVKRSAGSRLVLDFGARRMHPVLSPLIGRCAYIGGVDGVSSVLAAEMLDVEPSGTMPHALIVVFGDQVKAWKAFDEVVPTSVQRVVLVDTYEDEKKESIMAAEALGNRLWGVRIDTPRSRRGDLIEIVREVRWELDIRGFKHVRIIVSGGLNDEAVAMLAQAGVDGFGVGTWISNSPTVDFALDIVEVEGKPSAKKGKLGGRKQVWRCENCMVDVVRPASEPSPSCPKCGGNTEPLLRPLIRAGQIVGDLPELAEIRRHVQKQLEGLE